MQRPLRDFEWQLLKPLLFPGASILELGNKKNAIGVYKPWFESQGYQHVSVDINGRDGALAFDLREPVAPRLAAVGLPTTFDVLTNSGVIEHVETNLEAAWRNAFELVKVGGVQVHVTPAAHHWMAHGLYHPTEEFFEVMALSNDMEIVMLDEYRWTPGKVLTRCVLRKHAERPFSYPGDALMVPTPDALELARRRAAQ
jgi:hypothetical protein